LRGGGAGGDRLRDAQRGRLGRRCIGREERGVERGGEIRRIDRAARTANCEALEHVEELARVAVPRLRRELLELIRGDLWSWKIQAPLQMRQPMRHERTHIRAPRAQRRDLQVEHAEPEVQVGAEAAGANVAA